MVVLNRIAMKNALSESIFDLEAFTMLKVWCLLRAMITDSIFRFSHQILTVFIGIPSAYRIR